MCRHLHKKLAAGASVPVLGGNDVVEKVLFKVTDWLARFVTLLGMMTMIMMAMVVVVKIIMTVAMTLLKKCFTK